MNGYPKPACSLPPFPCSDLKLCHSEVTDDILRVDTKLTVPLCLTERLSQLLIIVVTLTVGSSVQGWCLQDRHVTVNLTTAVCKCSHHQAISAASSLQGAMERKCVCPSLALF